MGGREFLNVFGDDYNAPDGTGVRDFDAARYVLGWQATRSLQTMCAYTWRWHSNNSLGYVRHVT